MLEWVCPRCDRAVDPALTVCPFCGNPEADAPSTAARRTENSWSKGERIFRVALGVVVVLALIYFLVIGVAYIWGPEELFYRLTRWLPWR